MTHRAVDHGVADRGDDPAEHRLVDDDLHLDLLARSTRLERRGDARLLRVVERDRRADLGDLVLAGLRRELDEPVDDRRQVVPAARRRR